MMMEFTRLKDQFRSHMPMLLRKFIFLFIFTLSASLSFGFEKNVVIGIVDLEELQTYEATDYAIARRNLKALSLQFPESDFREVFYTVNGLIKAIQNKEVNFFLVSSGLFIRLSQLGVRDIATLVSTNMPDPNNCVGGAMVVRKDRKDLTDLGDLKGKIASTTNYDAFMSLQTNLGAIAEKGFDPEKFFSSILQRGNSVKVLEDVSAGRSDVGLIRACVLEALKKSRSDVWDGLSVIKNQGDSNFPCSVTTSLYPGFLLGVVDGTSPELTREVAKVLLSVDARENDGFYWSLTTDFSSVHRLFKDLKIGPYSYLRVWTLKRIWAEFWPFIVIAVVLVLFFIIHWIRVEHLVNKRTRSLQSALIRQKETEKKRRETVIKLEALQKVGVVNQLSSIFAHEMRQPLASMKYASRAILTRLKTKSLDVETLKKSLTLIRTEVEKADAIVQKVNDYARGTADRTQKINFSYLVRSVAEDLKNTSSVSVDFESTSESLWVKGDPLELQIAVLNLLKNAAEASPNVSVKLELKGKEICLEVVTSGREMTIKEIESFQIPFKSSKPYGLGLGLQIIKSVIEKHRGSVSYSPRKGGGVQTLIFLPSIQ